MRKKLIGIAIVALALVLVLTLMPACGKEKEEVQPGVTPTPKTTPVQPTPTPKAKTLKIGLIAPLSGPAAPWGTSHELGVKWKADEINAAGGIKALKGAKPKLIDADSQANPDIGVLEAKRCIEQEKVICFVNGFNSGPTLAASAVAEADF